MWDMGRHRASFDRLRTSRAWSVEQERKDAGTRRNGETEIRGQRSVGRGQIAKLRFIFLFVFLFSIRNPQSAIINVRWALPARNSTNHVK